MALPGYFIFPNPSPMSFFTEELPLTRLKELREYVETRNFNGIQNLYNATFRDNQLVYDYLYYLIREEQWEYLDYFINHLGANINIESNNGRTVLYNIILSDSINLLKTVKALVKRGAHVAIKDTIYHPVMAAINNSKESPVLVKYLIHMGADLNSIDACGNTMLMKAIMSIHRDSLVKYIAFMYMKQYSIPQFRQFLNARNCYGRSVLEMAAKKKLNHLVKYFIIQGSILPTNGLLDHDAGIFKPILLTPNPYKYSQIWIVNKDLTFMEFMVKLINICSDWKTKVKADAIRDIYRLDYPKELILNAALFVCITGLSHDIDSIKLVCEKEKHIYVVQRIQKAWRQRQKDERVAKAMIIQKFWRRRYYKKEYLKESCPICLSAIVNTNSYRLNCGHYVHCLCFAKWRQVKNSCPLCRYDDILPAHV